jgi:hypothetical protein
LQKLAGIPLLPPLLGLMPRAFMEGIDYQSSIANDVLTTYFNGRFSRGHSAYYAGALAWKSPEVHLLCLAAAMLVMMFQARRASSAARSTWIVVLVSIAVPLAYLSWFNALQIGIRYALPVIPLLILLSGSVIMSIGSRSAFAFLVLVCAVGLYEVRGSWPEMLGYYNRSSGGAVLAWHRFADSNSDWGHLRTRGLEILRERHGNDFEVIAKCDGPRLGRVAIYVDDLVRPDPSDRSRSYSWLDPFHPADHVGAAWFLFDVDAASMEARSQDVRTAARYRDCAVALLGAGMRVEAARAIAATEGVDRVQLEALWALTQSEVASDLVQALECSKLWSSFERHDLAAEVMEAPAFADEIDARQRLVDIRVQQQNRPAAIALLEQDAALLASEHNFLLLVLLYHQVARYGDAIATLRSGMNRFPPELHPALELKIAEFERLFAVGQHYHFGFR